MLHAKVKHLAEHIIRTMTTNLYDIFTGIAFWSFVNTGYNFVNYLSAVHDLSEMKGMRLLHGKVFAGKDIVRNGYGMITAQAYHAYGSFAGRSGYSNYGIVYIDHPGIKSK